MFVNTTGNYNTALGTSALLNNTTGACNTAVGNFALHRNTTATRNTAVGTYALRCNTAGFLNTALGYGALCCSTAGYRNIALGINALQCNTTGICNTAIGDYALRCNRSGICNTAVGDFALCFSACTSGDCNVALGLGANKHFSSFFFPFIINNTIAVGTCASTALSSNHTVWGNSSNNVCNCIYAAWSTVSDCRDKTNIKTLPEKFGLAFINKLRPVKYNWDHRDTYVRECKYEYGKKDGTLAGTKEHYGLIAQELKSTLDELQIKFDGLGHDEDKDAYRLTYEELIAPIIKSIQELHSRLKIVEEKVE